MCKSLLSTSFAQEFTVNSKVHRYLQRSALKNTLTKIFFPFHSYHGSLKLCESILEFRGEISVQRFDISVSV